MTPDKRAEAQHRVTWDGDHATFHCDGDTDSACRNYPSCECEQWYEEQQPDGKFRHPHPAEPQDECWRLPWLTAGAPEDSYADGEGLSCDVPRVDGPIETEFDHYLTWTYAAVSGD